MRHFRPSDAALVALGTALAGPLFAQAVGSADAESEGEITEVMITGTRLGVTGFEQPTPVTVMDAETLVASAPTNLGEALAQMPSLAGSIQNTTSGQGSAVSQSNGQNLLDLRQLGPQRTLVLLDGQRVGVTNVVNSVDINIIPQSLVKRVEVVTGGASASYGSDAVAGVVNFILDTDFEGLKGQVSGGITDYDDGENVRASLAFGTAIGDRGHLIAAAEYFTMNGLTYGKETGRNWFDRPVGAWPNPNAGENPAIVLVPDARSEWGSYGGTITAVQGCPAGAAGDACRGLVSTQFLPGGALAPFNKGIYAGGFAGGGDGAIVNQPFTPDAERKGLFLRGDFNINESLTWWAQGSYNLSETLLRAQVPTQLTTTQFRIFEDNAYLPESVREIFEATPGEQSFSLTRYDRDFGLTTVQGDVEVKRFGTGLKGDINDTWSWDAAITYQDTHQKLYIRNTIMRNLYAAADAVVHPDTGEIVCGSQLLGLDPDCVPVNLFGEGAPSQAAVDYIMGINTGDIYLKQTTADINFRGNFGERFSFGSGPISFAAGLNYRRLDAERKVDPLSDIFIDGTGIRGFPTGLQGRYGGYQYYNPSALKGDVDATEGYVEFGVPLVSDKPGIQSLDVTLAGRLTDYSQSGLEDMWKFGLNWVFNDSVRFRGTISQDTRAPSVLELFNTAQVTQGRNTVPHASHPLGIRSSGQNIATGNPNLDPEIARTYTAGLVFSPTSLPRFQASIDWYDITIDGVIDQPANQAVVDGCYFGNQEYCALILVNGQPITTTEGITADDFVVVTTPTLNMETASTSGLDLEAVYSFPLGGGDLTLRFSGNYLIDMNNPGIGCPAGSAGDDPSPVGAISNACGVNPEFRGRLSARYNIGRFGIYIQERYISGGKIDPNFVEGIDISENDVPAIWYTDVTLDYELGGVFEGKGEIFGTVTNLFDRDPPVTTQSSRSWIEPSELQLYDGLGRRYVVGVRFSW
jgi:iron complex outermembrane receptor protein